MTIPVRRVTFTNHEIVTEDFSDRNARGHCLEYFTDFNGSLIRDGDSIGGLSYDASALYLVGSDSERHGCQWEDLV